MHSILVVEDDHSIRVTLRETLEAEGYFVFSVANGIDGIAMLKRIKAPCVILLDQMMPLLDGEGFLRVKNGDPTLAPIPVVVMSAIENSVGHPGVEEFIRKPIDVEQLLNILRKACSEHP